MRDQSKHFGSDENIMGIVAYLPPDPNSLMAKISDIHPRFVCFLYEDDETTRVARNQFLLRFIQENSDAYIENVPLPEDTSESFEWLYSKINWEVDYFLERLHGYNASNTLFVVSGTHVPVVVALYTVALQRGTRFMYFNELTQKFERLRRNELYILPSIFKLKGEPYKSSAIRKYKEGYFAAASYDFMIAWEQAGDKAMYVLGELSACYDYLDRLLYAKALGKLEGLMKDENCLTKLTDIFGTQARSHLSKLLEFLRIACSYFGREDKDEFEVLADRKAVEVFIRSLYVSAVRQLQRDEPEQSCLLVYRMVVASVQHLFAINGIDPANFNMDHIRKCEASLAEGTKSFFGQQSGMQRYVSGGRLGALDCWLIFVFCFGDKEFDNMESKLRFLERMRDMLELRNRCFLEHGIRGVTEDQARHFLDWAKNAVIEKFLWFSLEEGEFDLALRPPAIPPII
jgi:hypothetical protein